MRTASAALLAAAALGVGACGEGDDPITEPAATAPVLTSPEPTTAEPTGATIQKLGISKDLETKPSIPKPAGEPPAELYMRDIVVGKGKQVKAGDSATVQYVGVSYSTGEQFDASWDSGKPFTFQLGAQMVIPGWDEGVPRMREGGRRLLVIPPDLGYGAQGQGSIAPNETLLFVIDLEKIG